MYLRELKIEDAPLMLEWMHDKYVVKDLQTNFYSKTLEDCEVFIKNSYTSKNDIHMAIVDDDIYMGTVSLKQIDKTTKSAEFAITIRRIAMGKGYSKYAMEKIIEFGFENLGLESIYWCVDLKNQRAQRFYDKNYYNRVDVSTLTKLPLNYTEEQKCKYVWYLIKK